MAMLMARHPFYAVFIRSLNLSSIAGTSPRPMRIRAPQLIRNCDQTSRNGEESKSSRHRPTRVSAGGTEVAAMQPLQGRHTEHNVQRIACWQALTGSALCQSGQPEFLLV